MKNLMFTFAAVAAFGAFGGERIVNGLGGDGWSLWLDRKAEYKSDKLYINPVDAAKIRDGRADWLAPVDAKAVRPSTSPTSSTSTPSTRRRYATGARTGSRRSTRSR